MADRTWRDVLQHLERQQLALKNYPRPDSLLYFDRGRYFDVSLDYADAGKATAFSWYEPGELLEILKPILDEHPPAFAVVPFSDVPPSMLSKVADVERLARQLEVELADGTRWITGTWWTKPRLMRGRSGWLALQVEKRRLKGIEQWDEARVRAELTRVVIANQEAKTEPVFSTLRARVLELEATVDAQLDRLSDGAHAWEPRDEADFAVAYLRLGEEYVGIKLNEGDVYELLWTSRGYVAYEMLRAATTGEPGRVNVIKPELREELTEKADRSKYLALMRAGKLKVGAVPAQTDSEWWLHFKRGKFWTHYSMDGEDYELSETEATAILRDHRYKYVSFED
ncbi:MAG TPA: hypothetical protein VN973_14795 [Candidatus Dormibacteraeota bacterium]|nr:hypothetical protein [Candidatus Dormibacteraeota bacterium]